MTRKTFSIALVLLLALAGMGYLYVPLTASPVAGCIATNAILQLMCDLRDSTLTIGTMLIAAAGVLAVVFSGVVSK